MNQPAPNSSTARTRAAPPLWVLIAGVTARISGMSPRIRADLSALLRPFVLSERQAYSDPETPDIHIELRQSADGGWQASADGADAFQAGSPARLLRDLEWLVVAQTLRRSRERIVWHAASLAMGRRAVTLVAESGAGKSTLTVGLALRGWLPLADDLSVLDPATRTLEPFRRCFHISPAVVEQVASADLLTWPTVRLADYAKPLRWSRAGRQPSWIVVVRRDTSQPTRISPISRAQAAGALYAATISTRAANMAASVAAQVAGGALGCWELNNSDLDTTLDLLTTTLLGSIPDASLDSDTSPDLAAITNAR